jgi:hypothetical protein
MNTTSKKKWKRARCIEDWCMVPRDHVELAIMENDEPGCEANIGRLVAVLGEEVEAEGRQYWVPIRPMGSRPWTLINDREEVEVVAPRPIWVRLHDLFSTQCFAPNSYVPGLGPPTPDDKVTDQGIDESRWRCKPGDLVMVVSSPWHPYSCMTPDMQAQIGRIGLVLGREAGEHGYLGWCWSVLNLSGRHWQNIYTVDDKPYVVEETVMSVQDDRLLPLMAGNTPYVYEESK